MENVLQLIRKVFAGKKEAGIIVEQVLGSMPEDYIVFSTILYDNNEINHVVFSKRQGLFLINVVADKGTVSYNGSLLHINNKPRSDSIKKTLKDTFWLKSTIRERIGLDVPITPIVVFEHARVNFSELVVGVAVKGSADLLSTILDAPEKKVLEDGVLIVLRELHGMHTISYRKL